MATIFYSVAGEGRGHATRARALVEALRQEHQIHLFASGDAFTLLQNVFFETEIRLHSIPCLRFHYRQHRLSYLKSAKESISYLWNLSSLIQRLEEQIIQHQPDLVITDFEPALPRAARRQGVPFISVDHQHFLTVSDLNGLPFFLRFFAWIVGPIINLFYRGQEKTVVSSFFAPRIKAGYDNVEQVGVMLRPEILEATTCNDGFLLSYLRRDVPQSVIETFQQAPMPVKLYGLGEHGQQGNIEFCPIHERYFLDDLANCHAVISTAGNQLVGEALYLRKPVLVLPEPGNYEQSINGHFLEQSQCGMQLPMNRFNLAGLRSFLEQVETFRSRIEPERFQGNDRTLELIQEHLPTKAITTTTSPSREKVKVG